MAFGRNDSDAIYQNSILPVLRRNNVKPVIINRQQSNDDLNIQIIERLKQADFCIADLTYTRPSVYFEAGFAQRSIPVIYTVRKDHLNKGQPEDLRVHFDLQMKPIIDWNSASDSSFADRLERRLKVTVLRDWRRNDNLRSKNDIEIKKFSSMPLQDRLISLRRHTINMMRQLDITSSSWELDKFGRNMFRQNAPKKYIIKGQENHITGMVKRKKKLLAVAIQSYESITDRDLLDLREYYGSVFHTMLKMSSAEISRIDSIFSNIIILCLKPLSAAKIEKILTHYTPIEKSNRYAISPRTVNFQDYSINIGITFHFVSGIQSLTHLKSELKDLIEYTEKQMNDDNIS